MKWVAFLNFKQKWTSLLLLLLTVFYLLYTFYQQFIIRKILMFFLISLNINIIFLYCPYCIL